MPFVKDTTGQLIHLLIHQLSGFHSAVAKSYGTLTHGCGWWSSGVLIARLPQCGSNHEKAKTFLHDGTAPVQRLDKSRPRLPITRSGERMAVVRAWRLARAAGQGCAMHGQAGWRQGLRGIAPRIG